MTRPESLNRLNKHFDNGITLCITRGPIVFVRLSSLLHVIAATGLFSLFLCTAFVNDDHFRFENRITLLNCFVIGLMIDHRTVILR